MGEKVITLEYLSKLFDEKLAVENLTNPKLVSNPQEISLTQEKFTLFKDKTIVISSFNNIVKSDIYTDLIIENAVLIKQRIQERQKQTKYFLDIGSGRGTISVAFASLFPNSEITAIDKNPFSHEACNYNFITNNLNPDRLKCICGENLNCLKEHEIFDCAFITIPTVVVPEEIQQIIKEDTFISTLLDGGSNGRLYLDIILNSIPNHISKNGSIYLAIQSFINEKAVCDILKKQSFSVSVISKSKRFLKQTTYTQLVADYIETNLRYKFPKIADEKYFEIIILEAIKH